MTQVRFAAFVYACGLVVGLIWGPIIVYALDDPVEYTIVRDCPDANVVLADGHAVARVRLDLPDVADSSTAGGDS